MSLQCHLEATCGSNMVKSVCMAKACSGTGLLGRSMNNSNKGSGKDDIAFANAGEWRGASLGVSVLDLNGSSRDIKRLGKIKCCIQ